MMKESLIGIKKEFRGERVHILNTCHDEANLLIPGECKLDLDKSSIKDGVIETAVYDYSSEVADIANRAAKIMVDTETEFFAAAGCSLVGRVDWSVAPFWKH